MRIISGRLKGHKLKNFSASHIRPTTDRVKESIFNKLMFDIEGAQVLDLFSGTGNLAFEAHSRGAESVVCVESSKKSISIIQQNKQHLKLTTGVTIEGRDVLQYLKQYVGEGFDVIFVDPPFTKKMAHDVMQALSTSHVIKDGVKVLIESSQQERIDDQYEQLTLVDRKSFGDKQLSQFTKEPE